MRNMLSRPFLVQCGMADCRHGTQTALLKFRCSVGRGVEVAADYPILANDAKKRKEWDEKVGLQRDALSSQ
jgi:hypothetical protein